MATNERKCPHCRKTNPPGLVHCNHCGGLLPAEAPLDNMPPKEKPKVAENLFLVFFFFAVVGGAFFLDRHRPPDVPRASAPEPVSDREAMMRMEVDRLEKAVRAQLDGMPAPPSQLSGARTDILGMIDAEMRNSQGRSMTPAEQAKVKGMVEDTLRSIQARIEQPKGR